MSVSLRVMLLKQRSVIKMKALLLLIMAVMLSAEPMYSQEDKQKHFVGSAVIGASVTGLAKYYGHSKLESMMIGTATALLVGIVKETCDPVMDANDMGANMMGAIGGSVLSAQFSWRF